MSFYQCPKCKRVWQYPIDECPFCIVPLLKMSAQNQKVTAVSKVSIPTIRHPKTPYFAAIMEDENNNKWAHKSTKEINPGEELVFEPSDNENAVAIWRIKYDYADVIEKLLSLIKVSPTADSKILILPALFSANHSYFRESVSPQFLIGVFDCLKNRGVKQENIKVASQSFNELPVEAMAQRSGLLDVCIQNKITPFDLTKTNFVKKDNLEISEEILNADIVLNLAILKAGSAWAIENSFRVLKKEKYLGLKYLKSEKEIAEELRKILPNTITLGEAEYIQTADEFISFLGAAFASRNFINLDRVFNEVVMEEKIPEVLENIKIEEIPLVGRDIQELQFKINQA